MPTLLFLVTVLILLGSLAIILIRLIQKRNTRKVIKLFSITLGSYLTLWLTFYFMKKDIQIQLAENICFDDWCATLTKAELLDSLKNDKKTFYPKGKFIVLHIQMSNHARGIAQKPSEPKVFIINNGTEIKSTSREFEIINVCRGSQRPIDSRLELGQSLETQVLFDIPKNDLDVWATIDEGPFITKLLLQDDRKVFSIK